MFAPEQAVERLIFAWIIMVLHMSLIVACHKAPLISSGAAHLDIQCYITEFVRISESIYVPVRICVVIACRMAATDGIFNNVCSYLQYASCITCSNEANLLVSTSSDNCEFR